MAETTFPVTPDVKVVDGALGTVRDLQGNATTADPVVSGTWTVDNVSLGTVVTPDADTTGLTAAIDLLGVEGTLGVAFTGTTAAGLTVTGEGSIPIAAGPPSTVDLVLSVPAAAPAAPVEAAAPVEPAPVTAA